PLVLFLSDATTRLRRSALAAASFDPHPIGQVHFLSRIVIFSFVFAAISVGARATPIPQGSYILAGINVQILGGVQGCGFSTNPPYWPAASVSGGCAHSYVETPSPPQNDANCALVISPPSCSTIALSGSAQASPGALDLRSQASWKDFGAPANFPGWG